MNSRFLAVHFQAITDHLGRHWLPLLVILFVSPGTDQGNGAQAQ
ncbi:hypothetical protein [Dyadobacter sp. OTU695]